MSKLERNGYERIPRKELNTLPDRKPVSLLVYVSSFEQKVTRDDVPYLAGTVESLGKVRINIWPGDVYEKIYSDREQYKGKDCFLRGKTNTWQGQNSLIVEELSAYEGDDLSVMDFVFPKYDGESEYQGMRRLLEIYCQPGTVRLFDRIMDAHTLSSLIQGLPDKTNKEWFMSGTCAKTFHDAVPSGLAAHSRKTLRIMMQILESGQYSCIRSRACHDVLLLGTVLHDLGKTLEYVDLDMSETGLLVGHLSLGVEILVRQREEIESVFGLEGYFRLQSILTQHHGLYGDRPRTVEAYLVHLADDLETRLTILDEELSKGLDQVTVRLRDENLTLH